jgi:hypothetical protein
VAKLTRLTHKIAIQLHLVAESCTIFSSCSRRLVRKILVTPSYNTSKNNKRFSDKRVCETVMEDVTEAVCPEKKTTFER